MNYKHRLSSFMCIDTVEWFQQPFLIFLANNMYLFILMNTVDEVLFHEGVGKTLFQVKSYVLLLQNVIVL